MIVLKLPGNLAGLEVVKLIDFSWLPPEINSALIYAGEGCGSLLVASNAWNNLSQDLQGSASAVGSVLTELSTGPWSGPAADAMVVAAAPYLAWLNSAAAQAVASANHAAAAASAFEAAQSAMVHPAAVSSNRALLGTLVQSNILGQNTPAIAANENDYFEMWAKDALAMQGYNSGAASVAAGLGSFSVPEFLTGLVEDVGGTITTIGSDVYGAVGSIASQVPMQSVESFLQMAMYPASMIVQPMMSLVQMAHQGGVGAAVGAASLASATDIPKVVGNAVASGAGALGGGLGGFNPAAAMGGARLVGATSVPANWQGAMPGGMTSSAMQGLGGVAGMPTPAAPAGGMTPAPMPMPMGGGAGGPGGPLGRGGASPHVQQNRPSVIPRIGVG